MSPIASVWVQMRERHRLQLRGIFYNSDLKPVTKPTCKHNMNRCLWVLNVCHVVARVWGCTSEVVVLILCALLYFQCTVFFFSFHMLYWHSAVISYTANNEKMSHLMQQIVYLDQTRVGDWNRQTKTIMVTLVVSVRLNWSVFYSDKILQMESGGFGQRDSGQSSSCFLTKRHDRNMSNLSKHLVKVHHIQVEKCSFRLASS